LPAANFFASVDQHESPSGHDACAPAWCGAPGGLGYSKVDLRAAVPRPLRALLRANVYLATERKQGSAIARLATIQVE
jgi:hypothetical protein